MGNLADTFKKMSPKGWAMIGGSVAVAIVFLVVVMQMASSPSYSTLMAGIDPTQTGKITSTLSAQGISYQLQNNGTAIAVQSGQTAQARVALATAGLLTTQQPGFTLMDSQQLGQSNFQQQITYERALEGQLASTIDTINGVSSAEVNLVLPNSQDQLFSDSTQPATASVLLGGSSLDASQVRGIAQLVSSSVPGLSLNKVTITGADGSLLWPSSSTSSSGGLLSQEAAEQKYDSTMSSEVDAMLAQTLGAGKAQVVVNSTVNANQATQDTLAYAKKGVPLTQQTSTETLKGGSPTASGTAGTASNIPAYTATSGSGSSNSSYKNQTTNTSYGVDKTITHSVIAPGAITQQSVSVLVDKTVPAAELPAIKSAVSNAVGLNAKRGDVLSLGQLSFAKTATPTPAATSSTSKMVSYAKYGVIGLGSLIFLIFSGRMLRRRERENFAGQPTWLRELESPRTLASLEARQGGNGAVNVVGGPDTEVMALKSPVNVARRQVEDLVERDPDRVAQQVRAWMTEED
ncbi:MAG TPA: flagellar basal-body MS-ring/collar protein FliF [Solirubrobacteraceae bacterium]|jgi:flagellar M-ring protein FliF|nr:flagellar basal-body MS-ring/collar protein FliF [Solirubrobacteraceae bacterium]